MRKITYNQNAPIAYDLLCCNRCYRKINNEKILNRIAHITVHIITT